MAGWDTGRLATSSMRFNWPVKRSRISWSSVSKRPMRSPWVLSLSSTKFEEGVCELVAVVGAVPVFVCGPVPSGIQDTRRQGSAKSERNRRIDEVVRLAKYFIKLNRCRAYSLNFERELKGNHQSKRVGGAFKGKEFL